jgi:hypothetical protein
MPCKVVHCKKSRYDIYIGRPSKWGNPFSHDPNSRAEFIVSTREEAIEKYEKYLLESGLIEDIHELKDKVLGCWCHPKKCHGDILKKYADGTVRELFD